MLCRHIIKSLYSDSAEQPVSAPSAEVNSRLDRSELRGLEDLNRIVEGAGTEAESSSELAEYCLWG
jgi:hypothetical protein